MTGKKNKGRNNIRSKVLVLEEQEQLDRKQVKENIEKVLSEHRKVKPESQ